MINNTTLVGRLTKTPELKQTNSGIAVTNFNLAVERNYTNAQGERETDFIMCQSWRGTAEIISKLGVKGALVGITGNIQTRNYENNQGQTVYVTEVIVGNFQMLEPKSVTDERRNKASNSNQDRGQANTQGNKQNSTQDNFNSNNSMNSQDDPFEESSDASDAKGSGLPF